jgi:hypothetical protein
MFPIPFGRKLSFIEIGKYWSREIRPSASSQELRIALSKAWWRGELLAANGPNRLDLLRALYSTCADFLAFIIPDETEPPQTKLLDDGLVEVIRRVRVPLPNSDPNTWTEANCGEAFEAIAEAWNEELFHLIAPIVAGIVSTRCEFNQWVGKMGYSRPNFWGNGSEKEDGLHHQAGEAVEAPAREGQNEGNVPPDDIPIEEPSRFITERLTRVGADAVRKKRTKPVQIQIKRAVEALAKEDKYGGKFPPDSMPVFERDDLITRWLEGDDKPVKPSKRTLRDYFSKHQ